MPEAQVVPATPQPSNVILLPVREKPLSVIRAAVWDLRRDELLTVAATLVSFAQDASARGDDPDFYDRTKAAFACLERVLSEGGRL
jgi:hypothetical protein